MKKDKLYFFTFLAISVIFIIIAGISIRYFIQASANQLLNTQLESSKREAKEIASLISYQLASGLPKDSIINNIQKTIENTDLETGSISMFDWSGIEICNPDIKKVGQQLSPNESFVSGIKDNISSEDFYDLLMSRRQVGGIRDFGNAERESEIIYLYPVDNSDWIIAAHANITRIYTQIDGLRNTFYVIFTIMGFFIILSSVIMVRLIGSAYEKRLELKNQKLEDEIINLAKLNSALEKYQQRAIDEKPQINTVGKKTEKGKKRILTYLRNELLPVPTEEIAYIFTEHTITYVVNFDGKRSTTNNSLDELFSNLNESDFYRANRQFIIAISAIEKIIRYGNNQLKILVSPNSEVDVIISKNKAAEFKQWLNL
ncbi:LytTR family transcriptional regulator [Leptobacterium flavescens]|uniref:LytTR family transcriptional regulator n=1 Tax=Leptobacterium flavescens TaxID=472055 RepID=A0A6P0UJ91_9FLAO|nr:LytTR family transcriptional regulator DNA-binding domain-containing protein [Leptobacterium flavescens]NER13441.1 LytTR family transcriptional regulator [Leptobacterium flavescens]